MADIYGLVVNKQVILYPLTIEDINARNNPTEDYYLCYFDLEPHYNSVTQSIRHYPRVVGTSIFVTYEVYDKTVDDLLSELAPYIHVEMLAGRQPILPNLPTSLVMGVVDLVKKKVQARLDAFAQEKDYDDMKSACSYDGSSETEFYQQAQRCIYLRDLTWRTLYDYINNLMVGVGDLPTSWIDIEARLPPLTWI